MSEKHRPDGSILTAALRGLRFPAVSLLCLAGLVMPASHAHAQATATASRAGDLQVGGGFSIGSGDYDRPTYRGYTGYASFDFKPNFGIEVDFHQLNTASPATYYERSYEVGGRYVRHYGIFNPYARLMYGRGVFNYQYNLANLAYNQIDGAVGVDINVQRRVNVRAEYEYQSWLNFKGIVRTNDIVGSGTLTPQMFTIGAAYHFR